MTKRVNNYIISLMKIDLISLIDNDGFKVPFEFKISQKENSLAIRAKVSGSVSNLSGALQLDAHIIAEVSDNCARCLEHAETKIEFDIKEKVEDDENLSGSLLDMGSISLQNIYLNMPLRLLCRHDCKGLCANCGANLNKGQCKCNDNVADERLSVLKKLLD